MMQKIKTIIRHAVSSDSQNIANIEKECFSSPWSVNQIDDEINKDNSLFFVAMYNDDLCGYVSGQLILDEFYINNVAVTEKYRRNGIASDLIVFMINELKCQDCALATLEVRESNSAARAVYESFGFINLGIRKNFYSHPTENACIYTLYFDNESECIN